jgi:lipopolysaccharide transport system permease protein
MGRELMETIYTVGSDLRHIRRLLGSMWGDLKASRELAWRLLVRNSSAQCRQSLFGYL